ncbi:MAG: hydroxymethylbilane synthase [Cellvibrionales bacterium TMED49]|nr:hydroxymethylbilane synthase [Porticoccaceae bacterium]OUU38312.1 MAG: hydroxymethylbilane synthase [Cellvibrionales bacterium TMED49]OUU38783.1 MAG: hydroxymethylbilane synthase [Cellvibrionales bacterium TMED49]
MRESIRIATRRSPLAIWQAEFVREKISELNPELEVELVAMNTKGDQTLDTALSGIGGKGLFIDELEIALRDGRADIAVHSLKDMPNTLSESFCVGAVCARGDPCDALVTNLSSSLKNLKPGSVVGTSSLRRRSQLLASHPHLEVRDIRGNVNTRLDKLDNGSYHAIILASIGLKRLKLHDRISSRLSIKEMLPAPGQGAIAVQCHVGDRSIKSLILPLHDEITGYCVTAERAVSARLNGNCQVPIAAYAELERERNEIVLRAMVGTIDGTSVLFTQDCDSPNKAVELGNRVGDKLLGLGADKILNDLAGI